MHKHDTELIIEINTDIHNKIEEMYLLNRAKKGDDDWLEKQRLLLADMATHLLNTAIKPNNINLSTLKNNLYAILIISDQFLPEAELKISAEKLLSASK